MRLAGRPDPAARLDLHRTLLKQAGDLQCRLDAGEQLTTM